MSTNIGVHTCAAAEMAPDPPIKIVGTMKAVATQELGVSRTILAVHRIDMAATAAPVLELLR